MKIGRTLLHSYIVSVESSSFYWNDFKQTCKLKTSLRNCFRNGIYTNCKLNKRCPNYVLTFHWMINWHKTGFPFIIPKKKMKQSLFEPFVFEHQLHGFFVFLIQSRMNFFFLRITFASVPELNWIEFYLLKKGQSLKVVSVKIYFLKRDREPKRIHQNWLHNGYELSKPVGARWSAISHDGKWKNPTKKPISWYAAATRWKVSACFNWKIIGLFLS